MGNNKFADILGSNFTCHREPTHPNCPALQGKWSEEGGTVSCLGCLHQLDMPLYSGDVDLFDEEDADYDAGPIGDELPTAEGDSIQDQTTDEGKRYYREDTIIKLSQELYESDMRLALFLSNNQREIIDTLRKLEQSDHPLFRGTDEKEKSGNLAPKIIAVASHLRHIPPTNVILTKHKISVPKTLGFYKVIGTLLSPYKDPSVEMTFREAGKLIEMPESLVESALEEFESSRPLISETNKFAIYVAWLYLMAKKYEFPLTQAEAIKLTGAPRNSTRRAVKELRQFISNLKVSKETPTPHALPEKGHME